MLNPSTNDFLFSRPLKQNHISAGFPSPADDYIHAGINLNDELIHHPASTFFLRVTGHSMTHAGIRDGDLLIVDRSLNPQPGRIVVAILDGHFTVKKLINRKGLLCLEAANPKYPLIDLRKYKDIYLWGVGTYSIHNLSNKQLPIN